jgi:hypothetical protein
MVYTLLKCFPILIMISIFEINNAINIERGSHSQQRGKSTGDKH